MDCNTVAICMISEGKFKIFDSHSRDLYGIPDPFGKCVLIHVESLDNLSSFFQNTYPPNITIPFEVKGIKSSLLNTVTEHDTHDIRQNKILDQREIQLEKRRQRYKEREANETPEIRNDRLAKLREMRKKQSSDKREKELVNKSQRAKQNIINESLEARKTRLLKKSQQARQAVENETTQQRETRLLAKRQHKKQAVENETKEERKTRLLEKRLQAKQAVNRETTQRERRLLAKCRYKKQAAENETNEQRETRLLAKRQQEKRAVELENSERREMRLLNKRKRKKQTVLNESDKQRESRLTQKRQKAKEAYHNRCAQRDENCDLKRSKSKVLTLEELIANFHNAVSNGPIYICTCCDQLWYKQSVCLADKIRASTLNAVKLLQDITSVNNAEWLCHTCMKHLKSGKVPPLAVVNGMKFPEKPTFFTLMNSSAGLLHPDWLFKKLCKLPGASN